MYKESEENDIDDNDKKERLARESRKGADENVKAWQKDGIKEFQLVKKRNRVITGAWWKTETIQSIN